MAFLGIQVSPEAAHLLSKIEVPGEKSDPSELHITLVYFGKINDTAKIARCLPIIEAITHQNQPFTVKTSVVSHFPGHREDKCAIIAKIESPTLHQLRAQLAEELDEHDIEYSKQFKEYRPHITLSYTEEEPTKDHKIQPIQFKVEEITLWGGENMDDKIIVNFPLGKPHRHASLIREIELFEKLADQPLK